MVYRLVAIEDEPEIAELLRVVLASPEVELAIAGSGEAGLALIWDTRPHLVILDVMLPGEVDGWGVFDALRADPAFEKMPVLMLSVQRVPAQRAPLFDSSPVNHYFTKPFDPLALRSQIERMLGQRKLWLQPSAPLRNVLGVLNQATEALDFDRRHDSSAPDDPESDPH